MIGRLMNTSAVGYYSVGAEIAAALSASAPTSLMSLRWMRAGKRCAVVLSGGNVDRDVYRDVLAGD